MEGVSERATGRAARARSRPHRSLPRMRELPVPPPQITGSDIKMVTGVRYDARQREPARRPHLVLIDFASRGTSLVPTRRRTGEVRVPALSVAVGA